MPVLASPPVPAVRAITVRADGLHLSGLLCEPVSQPPRALVVALHGAGMRAGYFHGQAHPSLSLLTLGASLGFTVLALDRPGYGDSSADAPHGQYLAEQSATLRAALTDTAGRYATGAGIFLLGHSFGGQLALTFAADGTEERLIGLDVSGCGHRFAAGSESVLGSPGGRAAWQRHWGPLRLYPATTYTTSRALVAPVPAREMRAALHWPSAFRDLAPRIRVPVRLTLAEHERWWRHDDQALAELTAALATAPVQVTRQPDAGHNISLGWAARSYHLRALEGFAALLV
ncbi:alpha/beta fold hydrolase [Streptomyces olivoreticuli]